MNLYKKMLCTGVFLPLSFGAVFAADSRQSAPLAEDARAERKQGGWDQVRLSRLKPEDAAEFVPLFKEMFLLQYKDSSLEDLGKDKAFKTKEEWLEATAKEEVERAGSQDPFFIPVVARDAEGRIVAYVSMELMDKGQSLYLSQGGITPRAQHSKGAAYFFTEGLERIIRELVLPGFGNVTEQHMLVRTVNKRAIMVYQAAGFILDPTESERLVRLHDYDPKYYLGLYKKITK